MQYVGGKSKVSKELAAVISARCCGGRYWEPFVGAASVIEKVQAGAKVGTDVDPHIIYYLKSVQAGWLPPSDVSEEEYHRLRILCPTTPDDYALRASVGYGCSFGGKFFGGYSYNSKSHVGDIRNSALKQAPKLVGIEFACGDYKNVGAMADCIYCDPPYSGTTRPGTRQSFDHERFWAWCQEQVQLGTLVLVTEFSAPAFAIPIWERTKFTDLRRGDGRTELTERLFEVTA